MLLSTLSVLHVLIYILTAVGYGPEVKKDSFPQIVAVILRRLIKNSLRLKYMVKFEINRISNAIKAKCLFWYVVSLCEISHKVQRFSKQRIVSFHKNIQIGQTHNFRMILLTVFAQGILKSKNIVFLKSKNIVFRCISICVGFL